MTDQDLKAIRDLLEAAPIGVDPQCNAYMRMRSATSTLLAEVERLRAALIRLGEGHWEARITNSWDSGHRRSWGNFATREEAHAEAEKAARSSSDTATYGYARWISDIDGEEATEAKRLIDKALWGLE